MDNFKKTAIASAVALAVSQTASAGTAPFFVPLTKAEIVDVADGEKRVNLVEETVQATDENGAPLFNSDGEPVLVGTGSFSSDGTLEAVQGVDERNKPWTVPFGVTQTNLVSMEEVEQGGVGSVVRVANGQNSSMFDMLAYDPAGENIFVPHETPFGAGVSRYNIATDEMHIIFKGDESAATEGSVGFNEDRDFGAFDPVRWTPNGTLLAGEEWSGTGRFVEICDPYGTPADPTSTALNQGDCFDGGDWRVLDNMPLSAQEGIVFGLADPNGVMYFVDEDRSGSVYKSEFVVEGEYNAAQTFVLSVDSYKACAERAANPCDPTARFDRGVNATEGVAIRTGPATWIPITDEDGNPIPGIQDPSENILNDDGSIVDPGFASRVASDDVNGTPFGRPEDATITRLASGNEAIFFTATSENSVFAIEETPDGPFVHLFASGETPTNVGFDPTDAVLNAPDNLAIDSLGNIYIIEDSPNTSEIGASGGDIWFARDTDNNGVAESIDHFMTLQVPGSEATGMIFNPVDPTKFVVAVQHPRSTGLSDEDLDINQSPEDSDGVRSAPGFGDAIWEFDLTNVMPPDCGTNSRSSRGDFVTYNPESGRWVRACSSQRDFNAVQQLIDSEDPSDFPTP